MSETQGRYWWIRAVKTRQLSKDVTPDEVTQKVKDRGGQVSNSRVMFSLAVGTAIGDHGYASVSSRPKVTRLTADQFKGQTLIQVCDGITEVTSTNEIGQVALNIPPKW